VLTQSDSSRGSIVELSLWGEVRWAQELDAPTTDTGSNGSDYSPQLLRSSLGLLDRQALASLTPGSPRFDPPLAGEHVPGEVNLPRREALLVLVPRVHALDGGL